MKKWAISTTLAYVWHPIKHTLSLCFWLTMEFPSKRKRNNVEKEQKHIQDYQANKK